jgi:hypothetical protein
MSPTYIRAEWIHGFEDGRTVSASEKDLEWDPMALPDQPVPRVEEINAQEEFHTWEGTA